MAGQRPVMLANSIMQSSISHSILKNIKENFVKDLGISRVFSLFAYLAIWYKMNIGVHLEWLALSEPMLASSDCHFPSKSTQASWILINIRMSMVTGIKGTRLYNLERHVLPTKIQILLISTLLVSSFDHFQTLVL